MVRALETVSVEVVGGVKEPILNLEISSRDLKLFIQYLEDPFDVTDGEWIQDTLEELKKLQEQIENK